MTTSQAEPTAERRRKGFPIERAVDAVKDAADRAGLPWRVLTTLELLERNHTIGREHRRAGDRFGRDFEQATMASLFAADPTRVPVLLQGSGRVPAQLGQDSAQRAVHEVLQVLGMPASACCCWVLGCQMSLSEWAKKGLWLARPVRVEHASGMLAASLGVLVQHYRRLGLD